MLTIDRSRYTGYLISWVPKIEELWNSGSSCFEIAETLRRDVWDTTKTWYAQPCFLKTENIKYILRRIGYVEPNLIPKTPEVKPRKYPWVDWEKLLEKPPPGRSTYPGRPLDMGGPRDVWIGEDPWDLLEEATTELKQAKEFGKWHTRQRRSKRKSSKRLHKDKRA